MKNKITNKENDELVLAIDPAPRGFGYVLFEGPKMPLDWGVAEARVQTNMRSLERIKKMIESHRPDVIILENYAGAQSYRCERVMNLIDKIVLLAKSEKIKVRQYSRAQIYKTFFKFGARNKQQVAETIGEWLPVLAPRIPPKRKIWETEDRRMSIFDAASLALSYFFLEK